MGRFEAKPDIAKNNLVLDLDATKPSSFSSPLPMDVEILVVAGGGGGGGNSSNNYRSAGGGGGGGIIHEPNYTISDTTAITVTVGAGGVGTQSRGNSGNDSSFRSLTAIGGGGGGGTTSTGNQNGLNGGSGGGGGDYNGTGGTGTTGQGNHGGNSRQSAGSGMGASGGGGGGAGGHGEQSINSFGAKSGGPSSSYLTSGTLSSYSAGGGVKAASLDNSAGNSGAANKGHGGQGARFNIGGSGGSGVVIIRYPGTPMATGGTITQVDGFTIHTFTSSGTFSPFPVKDVSGNSNHFDLINGPKFVKDQEGSYLLFDGVNDRVSRSDVTYKTGGGWTVESLVYYNFVADGYNNSSSPANFISSNGATYNSWYWSVLSKKLALWNISPGYWKYGSTILQPYTWYHAVLVCNDAGDTYQMYLNGIAEGGTHVSNAGSWNTSKAGLKIAHIGSGNGNIRFLNGKMAFTRAYDKAFTEEEVVEAYNRIDRSRGLQKVASRGLGSVGNPASSAQQLHDEGINENGIYYIDTGASVVPTYCEFKNGEGWMLVMNIKSDYFGDSKLTWNDYDNWINAGEDLGNTSSPFTCNGQYRNKDIFQNIINEKWMIKIHNYGKEYGGGSWAAWNILGPDTFQNIMNTPGTGGGGTQISDDYYAMEGLGNSGYANGLFWCPISRTLGHLRVNHLLNNNAVRILGNRNQLLETSNTDRTRGIGCQYAVAGTALTNTQSQWNAHISPHCANPVVSPFAASLRQFTEGQFPDGSNSNTSTQGEVILADGIYPHYGIFVK